MRLPVYALVALLAAGSCLAADDTTQSRLAKYMDDLSDAWHKYPTEKQTPVRTAQVQDLGKAMTKELPDLAAPEDTTLQKAVDRLANNLVKAATMFRLEKMNPERTQAVNQCVSVFKREVLLATDVETELPGRKIFEKLIAWIDNGKSALRSATDDAKSAYIASFSALSTVMLKNAAKDDGDANALFDKNLKEIAAHFPTKSPAMAKTNGPVVTFLTNVASQIDKIDKEEKR